MQPFANISRHDGIVEFVTPTGEKVRAFRDDYTWNVYVYTTDTRQVCRAKNDELDTPQLIWEKYKVKKRDAQY